MQRDWFAFLVIAFEIALIFGASAVVYVAPHSY
jgi:hypothetical protein